MGWAHRSMAGCEPRCRWRARTTSPVRAKLAAYEVVILPTDRVTRVSRIVVIGAGLGGLAAAARLAKLGHPVTIVEASDRIGGAVRSIEQAGFRWDAGPASTTLPAALRDLFRKSGRPIERYLNLELPNPTRQHRFTDGSAVDFPTGSRADQIAALDVLGAGVGRAWAEYVDQQQDVWDVLRTHVIEDPRGGAHVFDSDTRKVLRPRLTLAKQLKKSLRDERLQALATWRWELTGQPTRDVPAFAAVDPYLERSFGVWSIPGGFAQLVDALQVRLEERGVEVRLGTRATKIVTSSGRVTGVEVKTAAASPAPFDETSNGPALVIDADAVVSAIDQRQLFRDLLDASVPTPLRHNSQTAAPVVPPAVTHIGLTDEVPAMAPEVVIHGDPLIVVRTNDQAPPGHHAWTIVHRGTGNEDVLITLVRRGIDVRKHVVTRVDRSPAAIIRELGGSSYGVAWGGPRTAVHRAPNVTGVPGLYCAGASAHPGGGVPFVVWGAALVAEAIGKS